MQFHNKVVLVTGAARGIGAACARRFATAGANIVHYLHHVAFLASAEAEWITGQIINASGGLQI